MSADERDIVERLRGGTYTVQDGIDAAAEITRLRAKMEILLKNSRDLLANAELFERKQDEAEDALSALRLQVVEATETVATYAKAYRKFLDQSIDDCAQLGISDETGEFYEVTLTDLEAVAELHNACKEGEDNV